MSDPSAAKTRRQFSVGATIEELSDGKLRVVLDDLASMGEPAREEWKKRSLFTYFDLEKSLVVDLQLPSADYARIGELLLSRLVALSIDDPRK